MIRFTFAILVAALALLLTQGTALACTSFAVYSGQTIYGMNFDYAQFVMKLLIETNGDLRTFHLAFEKQLGKFRFFANTGGMNSEGLFYACQELEPAAINLPEPQQGDMPLHLLNDIIGTSQTTKEIEAACDKVNLVQIEGVTLHSLFADIHGDAMVVETGDEQPHLTQMTDGHIVMANFANHTLAGKSYKEAEGRGDYRYKIAHKYIQEHIESFDVDHGLTLLEKALNQNPDCPTTCSMVFAPATNSVFITFHRDFSKVWMVSIQKGTIEAFRGFQTEIKRPLSQDGLLVSDLLNRSIKKKAM